MYSRSILEFTWRALRGIANAVVPVFSPFPGADRAIYSLTGSIEALYQEALNKSNNKKYLSAHEKINQVIQSDTTNYLHYNLAGYIKISLGFYKDAIFIIDKENQLSPNNSITYSNLGFAKKEIGQFEEAKKCFLKSIELNNYKNAYKHLGLMFIYEGNYDEGLALLEKAISKDSKYKSAWVAKGFACLVKDQIDEAKACIEHCDAIGEEILNTLLKGLLAFVNHGGDHDYYFETVQEKIKDKAFEKVSIKMEICYMASKYFVLKNNLNEGKKWILLGLSIKPDYIPLLIMVLESDELKKMSIFHPFLEIYKLNEASVLELDGKLDEAFKCLKQLIDLGIRSNTVFINRGKLFHRIGNFNEAIASYSHAINLNANVSSAYLGRAKSHEAMQQYDLARKDIGNAIRILEMKDSDHFKRGIQAFHWGFYDKAITFFKRDLKEEKPNLYSKVNLVLSYIMDRKKFQASTHYLGFKNDLDKQSISIIECFMNYKENETIFKRNLDEINLMIEDSTRGALLRKSICFTTASFFMGKESDLAETFIIQGLEIDPESKKLLRLANDPLMANSSKLKEFQNKENAQQRKGIISQVDLERAALYMMINFQLGWNKILLCNYDEAIQYFIGVTKNVKYSKSFLGLAFCYLMKGNLLECEKYLSEFIITKDPIRDFELIEVLLSHSKGEENCYLGSLTEIKEWLSTDIKEQNQEKLYICAMAAHYFLEKKMIIESKEFISIGLKIDPTSKNLLWMQYKSEELENAILVDALYETQLNLDDEKQKNITLENQRNELIDELETALDKLEESKALILKLESEFQYFVRSAHIEECSSNALKKENEVLKKESLDLTNKVNGLMSTDLVQENLKLSAKVIESQKLIKTFESDKQKLDAEISKLKQQLSNVQEEKRCFEEKNRDLASDKQNFHNRMVVLQEENENLKIELNAVNSLQSKTVEKLKSSLSELEKLRSLPEKLEFSELTIKNLSAQINNLTMKNTELKNELEKKKPKIPLVSNLKKDKGEKKSSKKSRANSFFSEPQSTNESNRFNIIGSNSSSSTVSKQTINQWS